LKFIEILILPGLTAYLDKLVTAYLGLVAGFVVKTAPTRIGFDLDSISKISTRNRSSSVPTGLLQSGDV
jgi:hypothetical protein